MGIAIGIAEFKSIAKGLEVLDKMTKASSVKIVDNRMVCVGKFFVVVSGEVADVQAAISTAEELSGQHLVGSKVIPSLMEGVTEKINAKISRDDITALGIVEAKDLNSGLYAANYIKKYSQVELLKISLTLGLGGKSLVIFTGDIASVKNAIEVAEEKLHDPSKIIASAAIASPSREFIDNFLS